MHALVKIFLIATAIFSVHGQGQIFFANRVAVTGINAPISDGRNGLKLKGSAWLAQLYYTPGFSAVSPLAAAPPSTTFQNGGGRGYVVPLVVELADVEGGKEVTVQMRVWNVEAGNTYEEAAANPLGVVGESNLLYMMTGNALDPSRPSVLLSPRRWSACNPFRCFPFPNRVLCDRLLWAAWDVFIEAHRQGQRLTWS